MELFLRRAGARRPAARSSRTATTASGSRPSAPASMACRSRSSWPRPHEAALAGPDPRAPRAPARPPERPARATPRAPADAAGHDRLELRAARHDGAGAVLPPRRLRRRLGRSTRRRRSCGARGAGRHRGARRPGPRECARTSASRCSRRCASTRSSACAEREERRERPRGARARRYAALAERAWRGLYSPDVGAWLDRLDADHENIRAAIACAVSDGDVATALRICAGVWRYWVLRGSVSDGRALSAAALALPGAPPRLRLQALNGAGVLAGEQGDFAGARAHIRGGALARPRAHGHRAARPGSTPTWATSRSTRTTSAGPCSLYERSTEQWRELGDDREPEPGPPEPRHRACPRRTARARRRAAARECGHGAAGGRPLAHRLGAADARARCYCSTTATTRRSSSCSTRACCSRATSPTGRGSSRRWRRSPPSPAVAATPAPPRC